MKDLMWQMRNREIKKLTKKFVGLYKIKKIISENVVELELPVLMKIYPAVNASKIALYQEQVERQKKILLFPVEIDREKKYKVEKILNRRDVRKKLKYLLRWKEYTVEEDIWEWLENLGNAMELVEEFEKKIRKDKIERVQMRKEKGKKKMLNSEAEVFESGKLLEKYTAKILFR